MHRQPVAGVVSNAGRRSQAGEARGGSSEDFDVSCVVRWPAD